MAPDMSVTFAQSPFASFVGGLSGLGLVGQAERYDGERQEHTTSFVLSCTGRTGGEGTSLT